MKDFHFYAPTEVVFGEQSEEQVAQLVKKYGGTKVLVHYGGQNEGTIAGNTQYVIFGSSFKNIVGVK